MCASWTACLDSLWSLGTGLTLCLCLVLLWPLRVDAAVCARTHACHRARVFVLLYIERSALQKRETPLSLFSQYSSTLEEKSTYKETADSTQHGPVPLRGRNFVLLFSATGTALGRCV